MSSYPPLFCGNVPAAAPAAFAAEGAAEIDGMPTTRRSRGSPLPAKRGAARAAAPAAATGPMLFDSTCQHVLFSGQHISRLLRTWPRWRRRQRALAPTWVALLPFLHRSRKPGRARRVCMLGRLRPAAVVLAAADDAWLREAGAAAAAAPSPLSEAAKPLFRRMPNCSAATAAKAPRGAPMAAGLAAYDASGCSSRRIERHRLASSPAVAQAGCI